MGVIVQCGAGSLSSGSGKQGDERSAGGGGGAGGFTQTSKPATAAQIKGIGKQAEAFWDRAGNINGIPATAQERFARFLPGGAMDNLANAKPGKLSDGTIRALFGQEGAVSRSSLNASQDRQKMGQSGAQVERWSKTVGATGWAKATPKQRALITKRLATDELRAIGVEAR